MAIYKDSYEEAVETIKNNWKDHQGVPLLFAKVEITFGEKYMLDYSESTFLPGILVLENLTHKIESIIDK